MTRSTMPSHELNVEFRDIVDKRETILRALHDWGFVIIRNVFSDEEVRDFRARCHDVRTVKHKENKGHLLIANAFGQYESLGALLINPSLSKLLATVFDGRSFGFWGHSDLLINSISPWHKDDGGAAGATNYFGFDAIPHEKAVVVKVVMYLQDHSRDGRGLWVIPKSHREYFPGTLGPIDTKVKPNDVILFDVRLTHRGEQRVVLPYLPRYRRLFIEANRVNAKATRLFSVMTKPFSSPRDRLAIFFTVGELNEIGDTFGRRMVAHAQREGAPLAPLAPKLKEQLQRQGVHTYP